MYTLFDFKRRSDRSRLACIVVQKCKILSISDKRLTSFFISLILTLSFYYFLIFPYLFRFNLVVSEWNVHILFCRHIWAELSLLFWTFLSGTFFPGGWGGGCTCTQCTPPAYAPAVWSPAIILVHKFNVNVACEATVFLGGRASRQIEQRSNLAASWIGAWSLLRFLPSSQEKKNNNNNNNNSRCAG